MHGGMSALQPRNICLTQKCDPCTEDLNSATFGDSKNAILGDVQGKASLNTVPLACL